MPLKPWALKRNELRDYRTRDFTNGPLLKQIVIPLSWEGNVYFASLTLNFPSTGAILQLPTVKMRFLLSSSLI